MFGVIEIVGFVKLKWEVGRILDRGAELKEMIISLLCLRNILKVLGDFFLFYD
jgi:hypothetical protein